VEAWARWALKNLRYQPTDVRIIVVRDWTIGAKVLRVAFAGGLGVTATAGRDLFVELPESREHTIELDVEIAVEVSEITIIEDVTVLASDLVVDEANGLFSVLAGGYDLT
jgi:hypothetical protein